MAFGKLDHLLFPRSSLEPRALEAGLASRPWCVALSGGADSLALTLALWQHFPECRASLVVLHFNHRLRGGESDGDERFCSEVAAFLGVRFFSESWRDVPQKVGEAEARHARNQFFEARMADVGAKVLWTGHHANDVAETQLMRLSRGSGARGLSAPRPVQTTGDGCMRLRPLLSLSRETIENALLAAGWTWRTDASNAEGDYLRNRLRHSVVPSWIQVSDRDPLRGALRSRQLLEEDDEALDHWLHLLLPWTWEKGPGDVSSGETLDLQPLAGFPVALWRRALQRWEATEGLSADGFDRLLQAALAGEGRVSLSEGLCEIQGLQLRWVRDLRIREPRPPVTLPLQGGVAFPDGSWLGNEPIVYNEGLRAAIWSGNSDPKKEAWLSLETRELEVIPLTPGLRFQPLGMTEPVKLQDLLVNRKVPRSLRADLPVIRDRVSGDLVWVPGFGPAHRFRITHESLSGVRLTYSPGTSTFDI